MKTIVAKFGGTSVANATQIAKAVEIVRADQRRTIVVVSAPGKRDKSDEKITDVLIACHALASQGKEFKERFAPIRNRFVELARDLAIGGDMDPWVDEVEELIASGGDQSAVVSRGEYLGAHMIARYLGYEFVDATELIEFSGPTTVDSEATDRRIAERLTADGRYVIPGFYGALADGRVQLFTRGGSDISAALVARGVNAEKYENWTDVSGLLSADPRIVEGPKPIAEVSYRRLRELAYLGAAVFHEEAVEPAASRQIPINIRNTNAPGHRGTMIVAESGSEPALTGVAGKPDCRIVMLEKAGVGKDADFASEVASIASKAGIALFHAGQGADSAQVIVADAEEAKLREFAGRLKDDLDCTGVGAAQKAAVVGLVGEAVARSAKTIAGVLSALSDSKIPVLSLDADYSPYSFFVTVPNERYADATNAVYRATIAAR